MKDDEIHQYAKRPGIDPSLVELADIVKRGMAVEVVLIVPGGIINGTTISPSESLRLAMSRVNASLEDIRDLQKQTAAMSETRTPTGESERFISLGDVTVVSGGSRWVNIAQIRVRLSSISAWYLGRLSPHEQGGEP